MEPHPETEIRWLIDRWALWRDAGRWERFATVWHPGARMVATWFDGPAEQFIAHSRAGWLAGVNVTHFLGGSVVDISDTRALAETKMTIAQRLTLHGEAVDVVCSGRFYDFLDLRDGRWGFVQRQCIYENDRIVPVTPGRAIALEPERLARFPEGYRHLAYAQELAGLAVNPGLPGRSGAALDALYERGRAWLADGTTETTMETRIGITP